MSEQGYSVARVDPFWEVVERRNASGKLEHIVVDTMPRLHDKLPVKVYGPASKPECLKWARAEAQLFLTIKGVYIGPNL